MKRLIADKAFQRLLENATDLIHCVTPDGELLFTNRAWRETLGYSEEDLAGMTLFDVLPSSLHGLARLMGQRVVAGEQLTGIEAVVIAKDGRTVRVEGSASGLVEEGEPVAILNVFRDVTERKELDRLKDEFVATVSHELRTPLTSIRGALSLLEGGVVGELSPDAQELIRIAGENAERLTRLVNDILDLEKIKAGRLVLSTSRLSPEHLIRTAVSVTFATAAEAGVRLTGRDRGAPTLLADEDRVIQVLVNLLSNAIKVSPAGSTVRVHSEAASDGWARFVVRDTGPGIPPELVPRLFHRFQQIDPSDSRPASGSGLGLAIAKAIVTRHGGRIGVDSQVGHGATFWFELPPEAPG